jgi:hypothetical protein
VAALLEMSLEQRQQWSARGGGEQGQQQQGLEEQQEEQQEAEEAAPYPNPPAPGATPRGGGGGGGGGSGFPFEPPRPLFFKTRLCSSFTQTGYCARASSCTFAHGWQELRQPGAPRAPAGGMPYAQV